MTGSLDEDEMGATDMDEVMQMFFQAFGGSMPDFFSGGNVYFDMSGPRFGHGGGSYADVMFGDFLDGFDSDVSDEDDFIQASIMNEIIEIVPGLFCHEFIMELDPETENTDSNTQRTSKTKRKKPLFQCTICNDILRSADAAEEHYCNKHSSLMGQFIESLEAIDLSQVEIDEIFKIFADQVRKGKVKDIKRKKRRPRGPRVSRKPPTSRR
jgi:hypothetical protein